MSDGPEKIVGTRMYTRCFQICKYSTQLCNVVINSCWVEFFVIGPARECFTPREIQTQVGASLSWWISKTLAGAVLRRKLSKGIGQNGVHVFTGWHKRLHSISCGYPMTRVGYLHEFCGHKSSGEVLSLYG